MLISYLVCFVAGLVCSFYLQLLSNLLDILLINIVFFNFICWLGILSFLVCVLFFSISFYFFFDDNDDDDDEGVYFL